MSTTPGPVNDHQLPRGQQSDETAATIDPTNNPETMSALSDRSNGTARAGGASTPPPMIDDRNSTAPEGTAAGDPLAGVLISDEDAAEAVPGDTGPEHPGVRPS